MESAGNSSKPAAAMQIPTWLLEDISGMAKERHPEAPPRTSHSRSSSRPVNMTIYKCWSKEKSPHITSSQLKHNTPMRFSSASVLNAALQNQGSVGKTPALALPHPTRPSSGNRSKPSPRSISAAPASSQASSSNNNSSNNNNQEQLEPAIESEEIVDDSYVPDADVGLGEGESMLDVKLKIQKRIISLVLITSFLKNLNLKKAGAWRRTNRLASVIQINFRSKSKAKNYNRILRVLQSCLLFRIQTRILQKRMTVKKIKFFISDCMRFKTQVVVKMFLQKVRRCQRIIRSFLAVQRARVALITMLWSKLEIQVRKELSLRKQKKYLRRVKDYERKLMKTNALGMHQKWKEIDYKVSKLLIRMDTVQEKCRLANLRISGAATASSGSGSDVDPNAHFFKKINPKFLEMSRIIVNGQISSEEIKNQILVGIKKKRRFFISTLAEKMHERLMQLSRHTGHQPTLAGVLDKQLLMLGQLNAPKRKTIFPPFLVLTEGGVNWRNVVEEAVYKDVLQAERLFMEGNKDTALVSSK